MDRYRMCGNGHAPVTSCSEPWTFTHLVEERVTLHKAIYGYVASCT